MGRSTISRNRAKRNIATDNRIDAFKIRVISIQQLLLGVFIILFIIIINNVNNNEMTTSLKSNLSYNISQQMDLEVIYNQYIKGIEKYINNSSSSTESE